MSAPQRQESLRAVGVVASTAAACSAEVAAHGTQQVLMALKAADQLTQRARGSALLDEAGQGRVEALMAAYLDSVSARATEAIAAIRTVSCSFSLSRGAPDGGGQ